MTNYKQVGLWKFPDKPTVYCDVDDTLVKWGSPNSPEEEKNSVVVVVPAHKYTHIIEETEQKYENIQYEQRVVLIKEHINQLKEHKRRGHVVVVWSAGGSEWAAAVVKAVGLESYVDVVISKPSWYIDDLPANEFMGKRVFLSEVKKT